MPFKLRIDLARKKLQDADRALEEYLRDPASTQRRYDELMADVKAARRELMAELTSLRDQAIVTARSVSAGSQP